MTKKELEALVQEQSKQISELLEELRRRPQKEFIPVYPQQPSTAPTYPYPMPSTAPTYPWDRDRQIIPTGPCDCPTWPPQTWLSTSDGTEFAKVMNELKQFSGTKIPEGEVL